MNDFELVDDGTLDTVLECTRCHHQERYTFAVWADNDPEDANDYEAFTEWAMDDAKIVHMCQDDRTVIGIEAIR